MIDLHCHLDLYSDPHGIAKQCVDRGMYVLSVTTLPSAFEMTAALVPTNGRVRTAVGLHPELAATKAHELPLFERLLERTRYVGEVGLDGSADHRATLERQRGIFADILRLCARAGGKILSLHSRGAADLILDELSAEPAAGTPILHWYTGTTRQVARAVEIGCWFSVGPAMCTTPTGLARIAQMPHERILPESDGPFGTINRRSAYPWDAWSIVSHLAKLWRISERDVEAKLILNLKSLAG